MLPGTKQRGYMLTGLLAACILLLPLCVHALASDDMPIADVPYTFRAANANGYGSDVAETDMGRAAADAVRAAADTDIAVVCGGLIRESLFSGTAYLRQVETVFDHDCDIARAEVTPAQLKELLEAAVSRVTVNDRDGIDYANSAADCFPQISGFTFVYDVSAPVGERVTRVELDSGERLDMEDTARTVTVAAAREMFLGECGMPVTEHETLSDTLVSALSDYIATGMTETGPARSQAVGVSDDTLISNISTWGLVGGALIIAAGCVLFRKKPISFESGVDLDELERSINDNGMREKR